MLTTDMMISPWNDFAESYALESGADQDEHGIAALTMTGELNGRSVSIRYLRVEAEQRNIAASLSQESFPRYGAGVATNLTGFVLVASGPATCKRAGTVRVTRDPVPTFRMVASWFGKGDPTVGDRAFDERYLIDSDDESLAREVLTAGLREAIQTAVAMGAEFRYVDGRAELTLNHVTDGADALLSASDLLSAA